MDNTEDFNLVGDDQYRDTDEMVHEYKLKQLKQKKEKLAARRSLRLEKQRKRDEIRAGRKEISTMRREEMKERVRPLQNLAKGVGKGMNRMGQGFQRSMANKPSSGGMQSQPRGMFGQGMSLNQSSSAGSLFSIGGSQAGSKFDMSLGRGKSPFTFSGSSRKSGGMSLSVFGSQRTYTKKKNKKKRRR